MRLEPCSFVRTLQPGTVVLVGELHGTAQFPAFVAMLVKELVANETTVGLGLELTRDDQPLIDGYMRSDGGGEARGALLRGAAWRTADGRGSAAMYDLLEDVRQLRQHGRSIEVCLFDASYDRPLPTHQVATVRDAVMAEAVADFSSRLRHGTIIALCGGVHARVSSATPFVSEPDYRPTGWHLRNAGCTVVALKGIHAGGHAWCRTSQGLSEHVFSGDDLGPSPFVELDEERDPAFDGIAYVGRLTASHPLGQAVAGLD